MWSSNVWCLADSVYACVYVCVYLCMYVYIYVCVCIYIYIYLSQRYLGRLALALCRPLRHAGNISQLQLAEVITFGNVSVSNLRF